MLERFAERLEALPEYKPGRPVVARADSLVEPAPPAVAAHSPAVQPVLVVLLEEQAVSDTRLAWLLAADQIHPAYYLASAVRSQQSRWYSGLVRFNLATFWSATYLRYRL